MRIAYLSDYSPYDISIWSGTPYYVFHTLKQKHDVVWLGHGLIKGALWHHKMLGRKNTFHPEDYSKEIGVILSEQISAGYFDAVITCTYHFCAELHVDIPVVFFSDVTFDLFKNFVKNREPHYHKLAFETEQKSLENVDSIIYASEWAKENAISHYNIPPNKIHVIEFGANLPQQEINTNINKSFDVCNLLFVGRNWNSKGGEIVLNTYKILKTRGLNCTLTIIGCTPPEKNNDTHIKVIPWLNKNNKKDMDMYISILKRSHFMVLPTRFDAFGIVLCEASSFGIPSITTNICGVMQPIKNGINGVLLPLEAKPKDYADKICEIFCNQTLYNTMSKNAIQEYSKRLNWQVWEERVAGLLKKVYETKVRTTFYIPVYTINLAKRKERLIHLQQQFKNRNEFKVTHVEAVNHNIGKIGLWYSIKKIIKLAQKQNEDLIIICEDDHVFTKQYNKNYFFYNLIEAFADGAEIFSGGIGGFGKAVPESTHRFKIDWFYSTQFIAISSKMFHKILEYDFKKTDTADGVLSVLANNIQTIYPFISTQKDFGYSDVTSTNNNTKGLIEKYFENTSKRLYTIREDYLREQLK